MSARLKPHPAAELFPMMADAELDELAADIHARGQVFPIILLDGKILDGRNRYEACLRIDRTPDLMEWRDWVRLSVSEGNAGPRLIPEPDPIDWAVSMNLQRRHLSTDQRGLVGSKVAALKELLEHEGTAARERMRAGARKARKGSANGATLEKPAKSGKTAAIVAKLVGVSPRTIERAKEVTTKRPELLEQIASAKMTLNQAVKAIKREEQDKQVLVYRPPAGRYSVIVTDVPWRYDDQLDGSDAARSGVQYPTMTVEEIIAIDLGKTKAASDCALWFWVTTAFLIDGTAARALEAWGFEPKTMITWRKVDREGKDRLGAGRYLRNVTEHCILAVRGKPAIRGESTPNIFDAPRRGHSEKPDQFFKIVETVTPAPAEARLELFARRERDGWVTSGAELPAPSKKKRLKIIDVDAA